MTETLTAFDPASFVRPAIRETPTYVPARMPENRSGRAIKLDMNESPYGPSPKTIAALRDFAATHRYPGFEQAELRDALAAYTGKPADQIICGAGLDDVFTTFMHTIIDPGDQVIISEPTFGVYRSLVALSAGETVNVPLTSDFQLDVEAILAAVTDRTKAIVICNPNNPTGNSLSGADITTIVEGAPCLVAIDEAYSEFAGRSLIDLIDDHANVSIFRTMSKFAGLAGMRVGYGVFRPELMPSLNASAPPFYNISIPSGIAAIASLNDLDALQEIIDTIVADRDALAARLAELPGVVPLDSDTNFLLMRLPVKSGADVVSQLAERGVFVRAFPRPDLGIADCLRVTIGLPEENDIFFEELADILADGEHAS